MNRRELVQKVLQGGTALVILPSVLSSCSKDSESLPVLTTASITSIGDTSSSCGGNITSDGGSAITARGVCWSSTPGPTTALVTKTADGPGSGTFTSSVTGLTVNTKYYIRAYATNSFGTSYGDEISFTTNLENKLTLDLSVPQNSTLNTAGGSLIVQNIIVANTVNDNFIALSSICTHQGCTVGYDSGAANIKCPCHGSVYATTGLVINGPAPLALQAYEVSKADNILTISL